MLLLSPILLPLTLADDRRTQKLATLAIVIGFLATGLTVSRANLVALFAVLLGWSVLRRLDGAGAARPFRRIWLPLSVLAISVPFLALLLERFAIDPDGGDRSELTEAGLRIIADNLIFGTGPNNFVNVASRTEAIVQATGAPVHNSFLFAVASLGAVGAMLIALPLLGTLSRTFRTVRATNRQQANVARAYLVASFGIAFVAMSGWGFWQDPMLYWIFLTSGYVFVSMAPRPHVIPADARERDLIQKVGR